MRKLTDQEWIDMYKALEGDPKVDRWIFLGLGIAVIVAWLLS